MISVEAIPVALREHLLQTPSVLLNKYDHTQHRRRRRQAVEEAGEENEEDEEDDEEEDGDDNEDEDGDEEESNSSSLVIEPGNVLTSEQVLAMPELHDVLKTASVPPQPHRPTGDDVVVLVDETYEFGECENCMEDDDDQVKEEEEEEEEDDDDDEPNDRICDTDLPPMTEAERKGSILNQIVCNIIQSALRHR